jgi:hypothetical protein
MRVTNAASSLSRKATLASANEIGPMLVDLPVRLA